MRYTKCIPYLIGYEVHYMYSISVLKCSVILLQYTKTTACVVNIGVKFIHVYDVVRKMLCFVHYILKLDNFYLIIVISGKVPYCI